MGRKPSDKLKVEARGDKEIVMTRVFDAPRHLVYETMTKAEYVRQWWGCVDGHTMTVCDMDVRVGGKWRYVLRNDADKSEHGFSGTYLELDAPKKIVNTEIFDPFPDETATCTLTLEEKDGKTYYQNVIVHTTKEGRDGHLGSGMEYGAGLGLDRIEELAQALQPHWTAALPQQAERT